MATIGSIIEGKYEVLTMVGKGGMSEVYLAMDKNLNKQWAIKEIKKRARDRNNDVVIQSAIAEANLMKRLDHPCLPRIVDIIDKEDVIYVVMDYIEGEPLNKVLERTGPQPQETVVEWAQDLCGVLDYLHSQNPPIIYRDMKPANIMLQPNGNIKLIDFGIAREYKAQNLEDTVSLGTKGYAAPEQFGGKGQTDARTDIYCLGVTLYHLITGKNPCEPPYEIYPIRYWNPELSSGLESIILKCTQLNPQDRYQNCAELLYAVSHYEEMDDSYKRKQKGKVALFFSMLGASLLCFIFAGVFALLKVNTNNSDYAATVERAALELTEQKQRDDYIEAIGIKPEAFEAYEGLISVYKSDQIFSQEEAQEFTQMYEQYGAKIEAQEGYEDLAYEVGKLFWFFYDYGNTTSGSSLLDNAGDNQIIRFKFARDWFRKAYEIGGIEYKNSANALAFMKMGDFSVNYSLNIATASEVGWGDFIEGYSTVLDAIGKDTEELVNFEVYKYGITTIETFAQKFVAATDYDTVNNLLERTISAVDSTTATTELTESLKEEIEKHVVTAREKMKEIEK